MNYYLITDNKNATAFLPLLCRQFTITEEKIYQGMQHYYDTFDWRLYNNDLQLFSRGEQYTLNSYKKGTVSHSLILTRSPVFITDFPGRTNIRKILKPIIEMRALSIIFSVRVGITHIRVLNNDKKTIARMILQTARLSRNQSFLLIQIVPLRGYVNQAAKLRRWIDGQNISRAGSDFFLLICQLKKITPGLYSTKLHDDLQPELSVSETVHRYHAGLHKVMQQNEDGIIRDIDTEFLHDYRVAVRRIRSLYSQAKQVLPDSLIKKIKIDYGALGKVTNRMRDIDVYLLNIKKYLDLMPANQREYITPFFESLKSERVTEHRKLVRFLRSEKYTDMIRYWTDHLNKTPVSSETDMKILDFARIKLKNYFDKVLDLGQKIRPDSPANLVHKLRIECKKLRYLLEFYSGLFAPEAIRTLIRQLKILQDNLGEFNDYSIQQINLNSYIDKLPLQNEPDKKHITALGFLVGKLNERQIKVRKDFAKAFRKFSGPETIKVLNQLQLSGKP